MPLKTIQTLQKKRAHNDILADETFQKELKQIATKYSLSREAAINLAQQYLDDIASKPTTRKYIWQFLEFFYKTVFLKSFKNIYTNDDKISSLKKHLKTSVIILTPNHRSVYDFMILPYLMASKANCMPTILAAHEFTAFPVGPLFRRLSVYFVRRNPPNDIYSLVFKHYAMLITKYAIPHLFFIEGGRNKKGNYSDPKVGMIKYICEAQKMHNISKNILFVPINITYDYVVESDVVLKEYTSGNRRHIFSSLKKYIQRDIGNCYVTFGDPIPLTKNPSMQAKKLMNTIKSLVTVTPTALIAYSLIEFQTNKKQQFISFHQLSQSYKKNLAHLKKKKANVSHIRETTLLNHIRFLQEKKVLCINRKNKKINVEKTKPLLLYYTRNIQHLFGKDI